MPRKPRNSLSLRQCRSLPQKPRNSLSLRQCRSLPQKPRNSLSLRLCRSLPRKPRNSLNLKLCRSLLLKKSPLYRNWHLIAVKNRFFLKNLQRNWHRNLICHPSQSLLKRVRKHLTLNLSLHPLWNHHLNLIRSQSERPLRNQYLTLRSSLRLLQNLLLIQHPWTYPNQKACLNPDQSRKKDTKASWILPLFPPKVHQCLPAKVNRKQSRLWIQNWHMFLCFNLSKRCLQQVMEQLCSHRFRRM